MKLICKYSTLCITAVFFTIFGCARQIGQTAGEPAWPKQVKEIRYISSADSTEQPALFYAPNTKNAAPLLVALHTWSYDYTQKDSIPYAQWCVDNGWIFIHPNFRGANNKPGATGSELVIADIISAVDYAKANAKVDSQRIYLVGASGGGYAALLMAGRTPDIWAGVSAWVPISDLKAWYFQCNDSNKVGYAENIVKSCGGTPGDNPEVDIQYKKRSPVTYFKKAASVPLDINAGIQDGHTGSVPISHSLIAFNLVASETDRISEEDIKYFVEKAQVPPHLKERLTDPAYGGNIPLFRRTSGNARITIFDGGHEIVYKAALAWLAKQKKQ